MNLTPRSIRERAGTLVEVTECETGCGTWFAAHFVHQYVKDYIIQKNVFEPLGTLSREPSPDLYLAGVCMECLNFEDWRDGKVNLNIPYPPELPGFYSYAALY